jgi:DNA-binding NarL/FixJ family response regulator
VPARLKRTPTRMIRILLGNSPAVIPEAVRELIQAQPDMQIVGDAESPMQILHNVVTRRAQVVILSTRGDEEPGLCSHLLSAFPDVVILCIAVDLSVAFLQHRRPQRCAMSDTRPDAIMSSLRSMMSDS